MNQIQTLLRLALTERRQIEARRTRATNQTRQAIQRGASEEELRNLMSEMDLADADRIASQQRFLRSVDPILSVQQLARLRVFEAVIEQRIRAMIDQARALAGPASTAYGLIPTVAADLFLSHQQDLQIHQIRLCRAGNDQITGRLQKVRRVV